MDDAHGAPAALRIYVWNPQGLIPPSDCVGWTCLIEVLGAKSHGFRNTKQQAETESKRFWGRFWSEQSSDIRRPSSMYFWFAKIFRLGAHLLRPFRGNKPGYFSGEETQVKRSVQEIIPVGGRRGLPHYAVQQVEVRSDKVIFIETSIEERGITPNVAQVWRMC
jgi:hypothetical protein